MCNYRHKQTALAAHADEALSPFREMAAKKFGLPDASGTFRVIDVKTMSDEDLVTVSTASLDDGVLARAKQWAASTGDRLLSLQIDTSVFTVDMMRVLATVSLSQKRSIFATPGSRPPMATRKATAEQVCLVQEARSQHEGFQKSSK